MFKPAAAGTDMPDMDMGMSRIQMMSSVSVPVVSVSIYPAGFTYPCQTLAAISSKALRSAHTCSGTSWTKVLFYSLPQPSFILTFSFKECMHTPLLLLPYLDPIVQRLLKLLNNPAGNPSSVRPKRWEKTTPNSIKNKHKFSLFFGDFYYFFIRFLAELNTI